MNMIAVLFERDSDHIQRAAQTWVNLGCRILTVGDDMSIIAKGLNDALVAVSEVRATTSK
jgi:hypothetical protein